MAKTFKKKNRVQEPLAQRREGFDRRSEAKYFVVGPFCTLMGPDSKNLKSQLPKTLGPQLVTGFGRGHKEEGGGAMPVQDLAIWQLKWLEMSGWSESDLENVP